MTDRPNASRTTGFVIAIVAAVILRSISLAADAPKRQVLVELLAGSKLQGELVARDSSAITITTTVSGRTYTRKLPLDRLLAITIDGKREVLNKAASTSSPAAASKTPVVPAGVNRSKAEIEALIDKLGQTSPDWWDSADLNYPQSLDLSWPEPAPPPWNAQKNVGQYIWDVINPNPGRWHHGIRLVHHLLTTHQKDRQKRIRAMETLGNMYFNLLQDYPRAAFWWRKAIADRGAAMPSGVSLAECYWRLGNRQMALEQLNKIPLYYPTIKLLADMGETRRALQIAEASARSLPDMAWLYAGDAARVGGQYQQALQYYQKVLDVPATGRMQQRIERNQTRARANIEGIKLFDALDLKRIPDGKYRGASPAYAGDLTVEVTVKGGRIQAVDVVAHQEKQFYSAITDTTRKIVQKQSLKGIDATTHATITSDAIVNASAKALAGGMK